jgi:hypothetical protein
MYQVACASSVFVTPRVPPEPRKDPVEFRPFVVLIDGDEIRVV